MEPCPTVSIRGLTLVLFKVLADRPSSPIDVFVTYDGKRASDITVSRYAVRHLVSEEVWASSSQTLAPVY